MELGEYIDGHALTYESDGSFKIGDSPVSAEQVRLYAETRQIVWANQGAAGWFEEHFPAVSAAPPAPVYSGFCQACGCRVQLREDLSCVNGHPRSQIRDASDAAANMAHPPDTVAPSPSPAISEPKLFSTKQIIVGVAGLFMVLALLFPPWSDGVSILGGQFRGWGFIGSPPRWLAGVDYGGQPYYEVADQLELQRLALELGVIVIVAGAAYVLTKKA